MGRHRRSTILVLLMATGLLAIPAPVTAGFDGFDDPPRKKSGGGAKKTKKPASSGGKPVNLDEPFPKGAREKEFVKLLGKDYKVRYTDHFVVLYNAEEDVVKDFLHRIEKTFDSVHRFAETLQIKVVYKADKLPIVFSSEHDQFRGVFKRIRGADPPNDAAGLYLSGKPNVSLFYDMSKNPFMKEWASKVTLLQDEARKSNDPNTKKAKLREAQWYANRSLVYQEDQNRSVVQHEVAHQLLYNFRVHNWDASWTNPQWLVEGMATLFEVPPGKRGAGINVINQRRLGDIREKLPAFKTQEWRQFIGEPSPGRGMLSNDGYATSWTLTYYLVKRKPRELAKYVEMIKARKTDEPVEPAKEVADFEKCFGKVDDKFTRAVADFIKKLPFRPE